MAGTLNDYFEMMSDWVDGANPDRGEALTWHRVIKACEEIGEAAEHMPRDGGSFEKDKLVAELMDVAFASLGAVVHLNRRVRHSIPDFPSELHDWTGSEAARCHVEPGTTAESVARSASSRGYGLEGHFQSLVAAGGKLCDTMLGMSGQNPRKGVYARSLDVSDALMNCALLSFETISCLHGYDPDAFDPTARLTELGAWLVVRAGIVEAPA